MFSALNIHNGDESVVVVPAAERSGSGLGCFQRCKYRSSHFAKPSRRSASGAEPPERSRRGRGGEGSGGGQTPGPGRRGGRYPAAPGPLATPRIWDKRILWDNLELSALVAPSDGEGKLLLKRWHCQGISFCANDATGTDRFRKNFKGRRPKKAE